MKRLVVFFLFLSLIMVCVGCITSTDEKGMVPEVSFYYINESNHNVSLLGTTLGDTSSFVVASDTLLHPGDTGRFWGHSFNTANGGPFETFGQLNIVKIMFLGIPNHCLLFSGDVSDSAIDIRTISAYELISTVSSSMKKDSYFYHIKEDLFNVSVPCSD